MRASILELYNAGWSLRDIERMTGLPYTTVYGRLRAYGVKFRPRGGSNTHGLSSDEFERTRFMYEVLEMTTTEIAEKLGITASSVSNRLHRAGVKMRTSSESNRILWSRKPKTWTRREVVAA